MQHKIKHMSVRRFFFMEKKLPDYSSMMVRQEFQIQTAAGATDQQSILLYSEVCLQEACLVGTL